MLPNFPKKFRYPYDYKSLSEPLTKSIEMGQPLDIQDWQNSVARHLDRDRDLEDYLSNLSSSSGGSSVGLTYTVSTTTTPEPFKSSADFQGDGSDDSVAIQAAIDAGALSIFLFPGIFLIQNPIDTKGCTITAFGSGPGNQTLSFGAIIANLTSNIPIIDNTPSGFNGYLENITIFQAAGTRAAIISVAAAGGLVMNNCQVISQTASNADGGGVIISSQGAILFDNLFIITQQDTPNILTTHHGFLTSQQISNNYFQGNGIHLVGGSGWQITNNRFFAGARVPQIFLDGQAFACQYNQIVGNLIAEPVSGGIEVNDASDNMINDNLIVGYDTGGTGLVDGILITNGASTNQVECNRVIKLVVGAGKYGIEVNGAGSTNNFVSNNDLKNSATTASFNDTGTGTVVAAGNRL